ncbi:hypothetical protein [Polaribacter sp.]
MFKIKSIPDKTQISKKDWDKYLHQLSSKKPTKEQKRIHTLFNEKY